MVGRAGRRYRGAISYYESRHAATIIIDLFVVIVVGGLGSVEGALIASLIIGELQSIGILFLPQFAIVFEFLLMALVLIFMPHGLLGESK